LSCIHPLQPGDENYANCVAVPVNAAGVKLYPRRPFAMGATNAFDYPLSSPFDESDSYVVFDNVFVPWERVFIYRPSTPRAINGGRRRRIFTATTRRKCDTSPSCAS
jgi:aromatic ring hydroxylase